MGPAAETLDYGRARLTVRPSGLIEYVPGASTRGREMWIAQPPCKPGQPLVELADWIGCRCDRVGLILKRQAG
jgi:hypothetical protein